MKRLLIMVAVAALALPVLASPVLAAPAFAEDVTVTITGEQARGGEILVWLQTKDEYMQPRGSYGAKAASPAANGMPKEGWAMLNGDKLRAAPTFDVTSFTVGNAPVKLTVPMIYFPG